MKIIFSLIYFIFGSIIAKLIMWISENLSYGFKTFSTIFFCDNCLCLESFFEKFFVISYIKNKGKCSRCGYKTNLDKLIFNLASSFANMIAYLTLNHSVKFIFIILILNTLLFIAYYDYKTHYVLDSSLVILAILSISYCLYQIFILKSFYLDYIFSTIMIVIFFLCVRIIGKLILKKESLGIGDIYLVGIMAMCIKPFEMIISVLIGSVVGCVIEIIRIKTNKTERDLEIAFCPYLCFGLYIVLLYGDILSKMILR